MIILRFVEVSHGRFRTCTVYDVWSFADWSDVLPFSCFITFKIFVEKQINKTLSVINIVNNIVNNIIINGILIPPT